MWLLRGVWDSCWFCFLIVWLFWFVVLDCFCLVFGVSVLFGGCWGLALSFLCWFGWGLFFWGLFFGLLGWLGVLVGVGLCVVIVRCGLFVEVLVFWWCGGFLVCFGLCFFVGLVFLVVFCFFLLGFGWSFLVWWGVGRFFFCCCCWVGVLGGGCCGDGVSVFCWCLFGVWGLSVLVFGGVCALDCVFFYGGFVWLV